MISEGSRLAIYGDDDFTRLIVEQIKLTSLYRISFIISTEKKSFCGFDCYTLEDLKDRIREIDDILIVEQMPFKNDKIFELHENGINDCYILNKESQTYFDEFGRFNMGAIQHYRLDEKPVLRYLETHLVDYCNLKCKGCTHFANICQEPGFVNVVDYEKQLAQLSNLCDVAILRLMGGEPFLHPDLIEVFTKTRSYFPRAQIFIVTNGLLIDSLKEEICKSIVDNRIIVNISPYPQTVNKREKIESFLIRNGILFFWGNGERYLDSSCIINSFHTCLSPTVQGVPGHLNCYNKYCWFLRDGFLSKCAYPQMIFLLNDTFNAGFNVKQEDLVNIFTQNDGWKIIKKMNSPMPFCYYCSSHTREFIWESGGTPKLSDYYVYI